jgi:hypothetical protein
LLFSLYEVGGSVATAAGTPVSTATQCLTDSFSVTGPGVDFMKHFRPKMTVENLKTVNCKF